MLVTTTQAETLVCALRRGPDGGDVNCVHVCCMGWKFDKALDPRTQQQLGRCGYAGGAAGSWRLEIAQGIAARAPASEQPATQAEAQPDAPQREAIA